MKPVEQSDTVSSPHSGPRSTRTCGQLKIVSAPVYISVMLFGMSTWIAIVGVWVEMPLLVHALPESWKLPSYLVIIIQCANLGPAIYAIWDKVRHRNQKTTDKHQSGQQQLRRSCVDAEVIVSLIIISTVILSMLMLSLFWNQTTGNRSVTVLVLVSFASLSCCTSSVVFLPYMARFPPVYISAYYFGQGLCGLVPGILGLAQLAGLDPQCHNGTNVNDTGTTSSFNTTSAYSAYYYSDPRFSVSAFFALIFVLLCASMIAFCCLNFVHACRSKMTDFAADERQLATIAEVTSSTTEESGQENSDSDVMQSNNISIETPVTYVLIQRRRYISLFITILIVNALWNGILPATQTYTCLPYGNMVYRLSVCLSWVVSPLATLPNMLAPTSSMWLIVGLGSVASMLSALHLLLAAQSPHPILQGSVIGQVIVVSHLPRYPLLLCSVSYCPRASGLFGSTSLFFFQLFCKRAFL